MNETLTHATTQPQPLAWACAAGHCPVIMSDTRPGLEHEGKLIGIHAGKSSDGFAERSQAVRCAMGRVAVDLIADPTMVFGALIGVARLVGVVRVATANEDGDWCLVRMRGRSICERIPDDLLLRIRPWWRSGSKWGLLLAEAVLLPEPIPMRGAGGVWFIPSSDPRTPSAMAARALEQWRKARATR